MGPKLRCQKGDLSLPDRVNSGNLGYLIVNRLHKTGGEGRLRNSSPKLPDFTLYRNLRSCIGVIE